MKKILFIVSLIIITSSCETENMSGCHMNLTQINDGPIIKNYSVFIKSNGNYELISSYDFDKNNRVFQGNLRDSYGTFKYEYNGCNQLSLEYHDLLDKSTGIKYKYNDKGLIERYYDSSFSFKYEYNGNSVIRTERRGNIDNDGNGGLFNRKSEFIFDENDNMISMGNSSIYQYDELGNLTKASYDGREILISYHDEKNPIYNAMLKTFGNKKNIILIEYGSGFNIIRNFFQINPNLLKSYQDDTRPYEFEIEEKTTDNYAKTFYYSSPVVLNSGSNHNKLYRYNLEFH